MSRQNLTKQRSDVGLFIDLLLDAMKKKRKHLWERPKAEHVSYFKTLAGVA